MNDAMWRELIELKAEVARLSQRDEAMRAELARLTAAQDRTSTRILMGLGLVTIVALHRVAPEFAELLLGVI